MSGHLTALRNLASWAAPAATLLLMPKCPACVAAYITVVSGIGLSFSTAWYLRMAVLAVCVTWLLCLVTLWIRRRLGSCCGRKLPMRVRLRPSAGTLRTG